MTPPCKGCNERYVGCHTSCKSYKEWKAKIPRPDHKESEYKMYVRDAVDSMRRGHTYNPAVKMPKR